MYLLYLLHLWRNIESQHHKLIFFSWCIQQQSCFSSGWSVSVFSYCHTAPKIRNSARWCITVEYKDFSGVSKRCNHKPPRSAEELSCFFPQWRRLPRDVVQAPSKEIFKIWTAGLVSQLALLGQEVGLGILRSLPASFNLCPNELSSNTVFFCCMTGNCWGVLILTAIVAE